MTNRENRRLKGRIVFAMMTSFAAGMVNVSSLVLFFSFSSNVTGHYAILASEIAKGNLVRILTALGWIAMYFAGSFFSGSLMRKRPAASSFSFAPAVVPMLLEISCLLAAGFYGHYFYAETLVETELLVALLLFAMGLQNGMTASLKGFGLKTTHLTGLTTDLALNTAQWFQEPAQRADASARLKQMFAIAAGYIAGGTLAGCIIHYFHFWVFIYIALAMVLILAYSLVRTKLLRETYRRRRVRNRELFDQPVLRPNKLVLKKSTGL
ncbi:MAG: YoaK family protein [Chitinophagaceae bacterium]